MHSTSQAQKSEAKLRVGVLINPIAGMGGRVGLKGTDHVAAQAFAMHAEPIARRRAIEFLTRLKELGADTRIELVACPSPMGEDEVRKAGLKAETLHMPRKERTTAEDTKLAIRLMTKSDVKIVAFVGGDGTARDILEAVHDSEDILVLGVPSGVKMYSGVFAASPRDAADVLGDFLKGSAEIVDLEVMDVDEEAFRHDRLSVRFYGVLKGPFTPMRFLGSKQLTPETENEHESQMAIAKFIVEEMKPQATYILGPGTTVKCIADLLGVGKTVLGVDILKNGELIRDVNEKQIKQKIKSWSNTWVVLSPIGRQGMLLGRGNQQISPEVIRRVGKDHVIVVATRSKIQGIEGGVLRVDTGDEETDRMLRGYIKVATDYREWRLLEIV
jgi:predicted polyphosphate/ATP-dependent NAD kinase